MATNKKPISVINVTGILGPAIVQPESVKAISDAILETYDKENQGQLAFNQVAQIMRDMYRSMNMEFNPTKKDVEMFIRTMDMDRNNNIDDKNLEKVAKKYLVTSKYDIRRFEQRKSEIHFNKTADLSSLTSMGSRTDRTTTDDMTKSQISVLSSVDQNVPSTDRLREDVTMAFNEFDFDKDGRINSFEFQRSLMRYGWKFGVNPIKVNLEEMFTSADLDKDGQISLHEFSSIVFKN